MIQQYFEIDLLRWRWPVKKVFRELGTVYQRVLAEEATRLSLPMMSDTLKVSAISESSKSELYEEKHKSLLSRLGKVRRIAAEEFFVDKRFWVRFFGDCKK